VNFSGLKRSGPETPGELEFCPSSCEAARAPGATVEVLLDECPITEQ
jgi:hypothetical protein